MKFESDLFYFYNTQMTDTSPISLLADLRNLATRGLRRHARASTSVELSAQLESSRPCRSTNERGSHFGILHGGASLALAETVASLGATAKHRPPGVRGAVGLEINAESFARDAGRQSSQRPRTPIHIGRTTQVWDIRIVDEADRPVCVFAVHARALAPSDNRYRQGRVAFPVFGSNVLPAGSAHASGDLSRPARATTPASPRCRAHRRSPPRSRQQLSTDPSAVR